MTTPAALARARYEQWQRVLLVVLEARPGFQPGPVISDHMAELYRDSLDTISPSRSQPAEAVTLEDVQREWLAPEGAGAAVGMGGRRVLQLVADRLVESWRPDDRTVLVSLSSLRRHLRRGAA